MSQKNQRLALLATALLGTLAQAFNPQIQSDRCPITTDSIGIPEVPGRFGWARVCFPDFEYYYKAVEQMSGNGGRPMYPTFGKFDAAGTPTNPNGYRAGVSAPASKAECGAPEGYTLVAFCQSGCYTPDQAILFSEGYRPIGEAYHQLNQVVAVDTSSTLDKLSFHNTLLAGFTRDIAPAQQEVLVLGTRSGGKLTVTENHPLVVPNGMMREASDLKVGDALVRQDGSSDPIVSIEKRSYYGRVYNVDVKSKDRLENIVVAEGFLTGAVSYQNEMKTLLNRRLLRDIIPAEFIY
ncbi:MAG: hypothetical protein HYR96_01105 [Deltaproteobacteria bacterium]|nr:hypothetical protein [Deltaproteobacteria bacterium]MBI3296070.1 hypothetical protein [Deltaproteobacteria bacterium]